MPVSYPGLTGQISGNTAGATANVSSGTFVLVGSNNITLSQAGNTISILGGAGGAGMLAGMSTGGNTSGNTGIATGQLVLAGGNNITLSGSTNAGSMTITISGGAGGGAGYTAGISTGGNTAGDTGVVTGRLVLAGGNGITLSGSTNAGSQTVTISGITQSAQTQSNVQGISAGTQVGRTGDIVFSNANGISFGMAGSNTVTAQHNAITTARASTDAIGLNTAQSNVTWTVNSSGLSLDARGYAGTVTGATNASVTANSNGVSVSVGPYITTAALSQDSSKYVQNWKLTGNTAGTTSSAQGSDLWFSGGQGLTVSGSSNSLVFSVGSYITTARASTDAIGLNTAKSNVTWTVNSSGLSLDARGYAGTGTSATNASITLDSNGLAISVAAPGGGAAHSVGISTNGNTAGDTGYGTDRLVLIGGNNITLSGSTNGGSMSLTISGANAGGAQTGISSIIVSDATYTSGMVSFSNAGNITVSSSVNGATQYIVLSGHAAQTNQSAIKAFGASNTGNTAGNTGVSTGIDWVLAGSNNITISQSTAGGGPNTLWVSGPTTAAQTNQSAIKGFGVSNTGQTAGNTGISTGIDWVLAGSNSITLSQSTAGGGPNTVWIQHPAWITTADLSQNSSNYVRNWKLTGNTAGTTSSAQGTDLWLAGGNGLTISGSSNTLSFSVGNYLTTARASTDAIGLNTAQSNVTWTVNSSGLSLDARGYAGTGTSATNASITLNSNGLAISVAAPGGGGGSVGMSTNGNTSGNTGYGSDRLIFAGGNNVTLSGSTNAGSMTITISAGNAAPSPVNFSAGTTASDLGSVVFTNANGISFQLNGSTISASANTVGTATTVYPVGSANSVGTVTRWAAEDHRHRVDPVSVYEPYDAQGRSTAFVGIPTATSAGVSLYPFQIEEYVSAGAYNIPLSVSFVTNGTSSGRQTCGMAFGIYTLNGSTLSSLASTSLSWQVTGNNSTYSINQVTTTNYTGYGATAQTTSAGVNITSGYTGVKLIAVPLNTLLTPGSYVLAVIGTNSTSSINVGLSFSLMGAAMATGLSAMAPIGSFSSAYTSGQSPFGGRWNVGQGTWTSAGSVTMLPASMNMASVSAVGLTYPLVRFWST